MSTLSSILEDGNSAIPHRKFFLGCIPHPPVVDAYDCSACAVTRVIIGNTNRLSH